MKQRLPRRDVVGKTRYGLKFCRFESRVGDARLVGKLGRIEEPAEWDRHLLFQEQANFPGKLMLMRNPVRVGGGTKGENSRAAHGRSGKAGHQGRQWLPLKSGEIRVDNRRRDGIEKRHGQEPFYGSIVYGL